MIELHADQLRFAFPEITVSLRALVEQHITTHLPRVLAEDRLLALEKLFQSKWSAHADDTEFRGRASRELAGFTSKQIEQTLRRLAFAAASLPPENVGASVLTEGTARLDIGFQRTLRIPDDGKNYPLPASLGNFSLRMVDDHAAQAPARWREHGGVMMPMYQAEAMWIDFNGSGYPFAVKIAAGKINAVDGENWRSALHQKPAQDYVVVPGQPWLDGLAVAKGIIRQFVAMPLGGGHSVEEQVTGKAETGGLQVQVYPLRADVYFEERIARRLPISLGEVMLAMIDIPELRFLRSQRSAPQPRAPMAPGAALCMPAPDMGLGAGGRMRQEIYKDRRPLSDWDLQLTSRCFVHLCNSFVWREITGSAPPQPPVTAAEYARHKMPWFDYYNEQAAVLPGSKILAAVKSVLQFGQDKGEATLPGEGPVPVMKVASVGPQNRPGQVHEWSGD